MSNSDSKVVPLRSKIKGTKKVIFADFAAVKFTSLIRWLKKEGVASDNMSNPDSFLARISTERFDVCVVNLLMGGMGPFQFISKIRETSSNRKIKIIVLSKQVHKSNIQNSIRAGANDFIADPFENENLFHRIAYHLSPKQVIKELDADDAKIETVAKEYVRLLLDSIDRLSHTERRDSHKGFVKVVQRLAELMSSNRTSLIIVDKALISGVVVASSDDPNFDNFVIALDKYPEVLHVMNTGTIVSVEDVSQNILTKKIADKVNSIDIGSLMVFPVHYSGDVVGVMVVRRPAAMNLPEVEILTVVQAIANTMAAHANSENVLRRIYKDYAVNE